MSSIRETEVVELSSLKRHPDNYKIHPQSQIDHIKKSIQENGIYRNIVVANDYTILAGHGVCQALEQLGETKVPVIKTPFYPTSAKAKKIMIGDNEIGGLAELDNELLLQSLQEISLEEDLMGTGFDDEMMTTLLLEIGEEEKVNHDEEWEGMPEFDQPDKTSFRHVIVHLENEKDAEDFFKRIAQNDTGKTKSVWFPPQERMDTESKRYGDD